MTLRSANSLFAAFAFLSACETYDAGDVGAAIACGAREGKCVEQCEEAYAVSGNFDRLQTCEASCRPSEETLCR